VSAGADDPIRRPGHLLGDRAQPDGPRSPNCRDDGRGQADDHRHAETAVSPSTAFLVLPESLSPVERAVFLLREVFGYSHNEIARAVGKTKDNCRHQLAARASRHVEAGKPLCVAALRDIPVMLCPARSACRG
jgi:DNA-directed RNA polymerase specialized sigma24 family protein